MSAILKPYLTEQEYLTLERSVAEKNQYYKGEINCLSGASKEHNKIVASITCSIFNHTRTEKCSVMVCNMRVHNELNTLYTYPDVVVTCGEEKYLDDEFDTLLNPTIIIEVLSISTKDYDRGTKFSLYRSIPSLKNYLTISSMECAAELYTRDGEQWILTTATGLDKSIYLSAINYHLPLSEVYAQVPNLDKN